MHGYTRGQKRVTIGNVLLAQRVQDHMMRTYIKYIANPLVRKDIDSNVRTKGRLEGKKGRPCIMPEQLGHEVQAIGEYEYCLGF
eukprot:6028408-Heterocapsa_arctica.AAC.1